MVFNGATVIQSSAAEAESGQASEKQQSAVLEDENQTREDSVTSMDEDGNIKEVGDTDGSMEEEAVENPGTALRARSASSTLYVVNFNTKDNATTSYTEYYTGASGYTNGDYGADAAYLGESGGKVKFMMSGVVGWVDKDEVEVIPLSSAKVVSGYEVENGRLLHGIVYTMKTPGYRTTLDNGAAPSYLKSGVKYYSYDGHYFYESYATMIADYQSGVRSNSVNPNNPYYNYYQYLPLRSATSYSASALNSMISSNAKSGSKMLSTGSTFVSSQNTYGVNALLMVSVAANESSWGSSSIAKNKNNLFGLNAVDSSPGTSANKYGSVTYCIQDFASGWMSKQYLNPENWKYSGGFLGNKGSGLNVRYASDPYWGEKAANIAYNMDKSQGSKDYNKYTIAIKNTIASDHDNVNVRKEASTSSTVLYQTGGEANYAVIILNTTPTNSFYRIQSDGVLNSGRTALNTGTGVYSFTNMYAYMSSDYLTIVNNGSSAPAEEPEPATLSSVKISTPPTKTTYTEGDRFDAAGMKVTAAWSDGSTTDVTGSVTYSTAALTTSDTSVTVSYTSGGVTKTASQSITVNKKPTVTEVKINPAEISLQQGESKTFGVFVTGTEAFSKEVTWSVTGNAASGTSIDENGRLTVGEDETADTLTVKAVSTMDSSKSAQATVTVVKKASEEEKTTELKDEGGSGISVSTVFAEGASEVSLSVKEITETSGEYDYEALIEPVAGMEVLGVYDISLSEESEGKITVTFEVDAAYEGMAATIIHYVKGEGDEVFTETYDKDDEGNPLTVKDGKVTVTLDSLSPVILAVESQNADEETSEASEEEDQSAAGGTENDGSGTGNGILAGGSSESDTAVSAGSGSSGSSGETGDTATGNGDAAANSLTASGDGSSESASAAGEGTGAGTQNQEASQPEESAQTGDSFALGLWIVMATAAALGITALLLTRKTRRSE